MSGNTLQYAETPDGKTALHAGTWHWIEDDERTSTADLVDTTISTSWETCDLSGRVPPGTVAIFGRFKIYSNDTDDLFVLMTRPYGSAETDATKLNTIGYGADIGAWTYHGGYAMAFILAPNGKFQYANPSATLTITGIEFELWGYMI